MSKKSYKLSVAAVEKTTEDCTILTLDVPMDIRPAFAYQQGQYLTLIADINGESVRRSYSLCSSPMDDAWQVGIKQIPEGKFSTYANQILKAGDTLEVLPPNGSFFVPVAPDQARNYVAFAAGSGITPILSIIKTHLQAEPNATFKLFYVNQTVNSIILKEELEGLKNRFMERLEIFYFLTRERRSVPLFNGRPDAEKMEIIFKTICDIEQIDHYFSCGPEPMVLLIRDFLLEKKVPKDRIHFELFNTGGAPEKRKEIAKQLSGKVSDVTIIEGGITTNFTIAQGSDNLLDAAMRNSADLPYACKGGVCCTCRAKLIEGKVETLVNYGLEEEEIKAGYILTCQALPISEKVVVDFDV